jgi:peptidoglycan/xylan/chitin deacetylase (PgdA/CDA1 family)
MVPHKSPSIFEKLMPQRLWRVPNAGKTLYLTFDDGPIPELTPWVLDELKRRNAKATFFCVGSNVEQHPDIFQRILEEEHAVGNHTQHHLNGWKTDIEKYLMDIDACQKALDSNGAQTKLFRPPYGRLTWQQRKQLEEHQIVMWDVLSKDYLMTLDPKVVLEESIKATEPGSIIVFHDNIKAEKNIRYALPLYMDHFLKMGYKFESLPC